MKLDPAKLPDLFADVDEDRAVDLALADLRDIDVALGRLRGRFPEDHPTVDREIRSLWAGVALVRKWLGGGQ